MIFFKLFSGTCVSKVFLKLFNHYSGDGRPLTSCIYCKEPRTAPFSRQVCASFLNNPQVEMDHIVPSTIAHSRSARALMTVGYSSS